MGRGKAAAVRRGPFVTRVRTAMVFWRHIIPALLAFVPQLPVFTFRKYRHAMKCWLPRSHTALLNFVWLKELSTCFTPYTPLQEPGSLPSQRTSSGASRFSHRLPSGSWSQRGSWSLGTSACAGVPPRCPRQPQRPPRRPGSGAGRARAAPAQRRPLRRRRRCCWQTPRYLQPDHALHYRYLIMIIRGFQRHSHDKLLPGPIFPLRDSFHVFLLRLTFAQFSSTDSQVSRIFWFGRTL